MKEVQLPLPDFDSIRQANLRRAKLIPNPQEYPNAGKENRMKDQFTEVTKMVTHETPMLPGIDYALLAQ